MTGYEDIPLSCVLPPSNDQPLPPGCTLLFYETYGKGSPEQELSPRYALFAEDCIVQAIPEHPKKENVFCLSNTYGDVYLFQVRSTSSNSLSKLQNVDVHSIYPQVDGYAVDSFFQKKHSIGLYSYSKSSCVHKCHTTTILFSPAGGSSILEPVWHELGVSVLLA